MCSFYTVFTPFPFTHQPSMQDGTSSYKTTQTEEEPLERRISSADQGDDERDKYHDTESGGSPTRRQQDYHSYRQRKNGRLRGSTYRPNYDQSPERPPNSHWAGDSDERVRGWGREMTRWENGAYRDEEDIPRDEIKYPRETQADERDREYDS